MEDAIVRYANTLNKEDREHLIKYMRFREATSVDDYILKRKEIGVRKLQIVKIKLMNFLEGILPMDEVLKKLEVDSQSHST